MSSRRGVLALVLALVLLGTCVLFAAVRLRRPFQGVRSRRVLVYDVPSSIAEGPPPNTPLSLGSFRRERPSFFELVRALDHAAHDDAVRGLVLHVDDVEWGWARTHEFRDALCAFRAAHKPVYTWLSGGAEQEYLLASASTRIGMPAIAHLQLDGLTASALFLKGTYDKLGIRPNFARVGRFKSAVEQYTREDLSPEARTELEALLDDEYRLLVDSLASSRHLAPDSVRRLVDDGPYLASEARARGLVDTLLTQAELDSMAVRRGAETLDTEPFERYVDELPDGGGPRVALVVASGEIVSGKSRETWGGQNVGDETLVGALRDLEERPSVRAVVLRIDSPGGSGDASDAMWQEVRRLRRTKPVIVSMGNLAASGGYYLACGADAIVAGPATLTGSIGVFGGKLNVLGLFRKLGLNVETVSRGRHAEMLSPYRDFTDDEAAAFQRQLDAFYRVFLARVAAGRGMSAAAVDSIGQGRVWSGLAARRLGLVDELGGLTTALATARRRAGIAPGAAISLELWPRPRRTFLQRWLGDLFDENDDTSDARALTGALEPWLDRARFRAGEVLALLPFTIEIR